MWFIIYIVLALFSTTAEAVCRPYIPNSGGLIHVIKSSVGRIAELKCDVLTRGSGDNLFWSKDAVTVAMNTIVAASQPKGKYRVTVEDDLYKLRFKVDADDVGVYNCSCGSNFAALKLFVAVPILNINIIATCSNRTAPNYKQIASRPALSNQITCIKSDSVNVSVTVDGGCTYPGPDRRFHWHWTDEWRENLTTPVLTKADPCYTKAGTVYRYRNIASRYRIGGSCSKEGEFTLYLDDAAVDTKLLTVKCIECKPQQFHPSAIVMIGAGAANLISIIVVIAVIVRLVRKRKVTRNGKGRCEAGFIGMVVALQILVMSFLVGVPIVQALHLLPSTMPQGCPPAFHLEFWVIALVTVFGVMGVFIIVGALGSKKIALGLHDPTSRYRHRRPPPGHRHRPRTQSSSSAGAATIAMSDMSGRIPQVGTRGPGSITDVGPRRHSTGQLTPTFLMINPFGTIPERDTCGMAEEDMPDEPDPEGFPGPPPEHHEPMPGKLCIICNEEPVQVCFPACGHTNTCYHCSLQVALDNPYCPICRRRVRRFSVVYT